MTLNALNFAVSTALKFQRLRGKLCNLAAMHNLAAMCNFNRPCFSKRPLGGKISDARIERRTDAMRMAERRNQPVRRYDMAARIVFCRISFFSRWFRLFDIFLRPHRI